MGVHSIVDSVLADIGRHWVVYVTMPFIAALIGFVTKRVAIEMMFHPIEFVGVKPIFGWQGVLPANAERMARIATKTLTRDLLKPEEIFIQLQPQKLAKKIEQPLLHMVDDIVRETMEKHHGTLWKKLPSTAQQLVVKRIQAEIPALTDRILHQIANNFEEILDLERMVVTNLVQDKVLLNKIIKKVSDPEMRFIARSGIVFGFYLGCVQLLVWALTKSPIVLPLFGFFIGWLTDWLALTMIFLPRKPRRFFGIYTWQGMFQKRKYQIAADYGDLISREVITVPNMMDAIFHGPGAQRLSRIVETEIGRTIDTQISQVKPLVALVGKDNVSRIKREIIDQAVSKIPVTLKATEAYVAGTLDIRNTIVSRIQQLPPAEFEQLLRPAFKQDEWKLIAVGAIIGFIVGELQVLLLLH